MPAEFELIAKMQEDTALAKRLLKRIAKNAGEVASINHGAGRYDASADAMIWQGNVELALANLRRAHGVASKALEKHFGSPVIAAGPPR